MSLRARGVLAALLVSTVAAGCTSVSTDPQVPLSLQFDSLPALAVVVGDTMRGGDLQPARVPAVAYNAAGGVLPDTQVRLVGIDPVSVNAFRQLSGLLITGRLVTPMVRVVAQAGAVQSQTQTFAVVAVPTALSRTAADATDSLVYNGLDTSTRFVDTRARVLAGTTPLNGLRVRFRVVSIPTAIVDSVRLVNASSGRTVASVLTASDAATIRLKAYAKPAVNITGTVTLEASIRARGTHVPGSPLQFTVRLVPFSLAP